MAYSNVGLKSKMAEANTESALVKLLKRGASFAYVSDKTRRQWQRVAQARRQLGFGE